MVGGFLSGVAAAGIESGAVPNVVAGVTMVEVDGGLDTSTMGATVVEDERIGTVLQYVDRGQLDTVETDDGDDSVMVLAAVVACATLVTLQFGTGRAPPAT